MQYSHYRISRYRLRRAASGSHDLKGGKLNPTVPVGIYLSHYNASTKVDSRPARIHAGKCRADAHRFGQVLDAADSLQRSLAAPVVNEANYPRVASTPSYPGISPDNLEDARSDARRPGPVSVTGPDLAPRHRHQRRHCLRQSD